MLYWDTPSQHEEIKDNESSKMGSKTQHILSLSIQHPWRAEKWIHSIDWKPKTTEYKILLQMENIKK
jgi:hypothetical protein